VGGKWLTISFNEFDVTAQAASDLTGYNIQYIRHSSLKKLNLKLLSLLHDLLIQIVKPRIKPIDDWFKAKIKPMTCSQKLGQVNLWCSFALSVMWMPLTMAGPCRPAQ
jgi:hypothetical protein